MIDDRKKIGIGLTGIGVVFTMLGVLLLFDRALIAMGNVLFLSGVATTIGPEATIKFFIKPRNYKGTAFFGAGFLLVLWGWAMVGIALEGYGFFLLFAGFFPTVLHFLRRMPYLGKALDAPWFKNILNKVAPPQQLPV
ncbi:unnamed protein product [Pedinophyceae sp. YPF-701]|nr:unnamed protein product [Pedinophyceae sp. YPF-701]